MVLGFEENKTSIRKKRKRCRTWAAVCQCRGLVRSPSVCLLLRLNFWKTLGLSCIDLILKLLLHHGVEMMLAWVATNSDCLCFFKAMLDIEREIPRCPSLPGQRWCHRGKPGGRAGGGRARWSGGKPWYFAKIAQLLHNSSRQLFIAHSPFQGWSWLSLRARRGVMWSQWGSSSMIIWNHLSKPARELAPANWYSSIFCCF